MKGVKGPMAKDILDEVEIMPDDENDVIYTVEEGDDLDVISIEYYGDSYVDALMAYNDLKSSELSPGQEVYIPTLERLLAVFEKNSDA